MMKQKKSFLDKIVGSSENDSNEAEEVKVEEAQVRPTQPREEEYYGSKPAEASNGWEEENEEEEDGQLAIDVYQDDNFVVIKSIVGGVRPEDLDLSVTSDMVTIKGSREKVNEVSSENYYCQECFWGSFSRSVILPCDIKTEQVEASMKNGILTIRMPKVEKNSSTKIEVRGE